MRHEPIPATLFIENRRALRETRLVGSLAILNANVAPGRVLTVEPGIYIPEEGFGVRLENDVLLTENGTVDLMADIPIEAEEIDELMNKRAPWQRGAHRPKSAR